MSDRPRLDDLLCRALELPAGERAAFLDGAAAGPDERRTLGRLLAAAEATGDGPQVAPELWRELGAGLGGGALASGERLGAYRILGELGRGGMARVYLGERADGLYEQRVALKVLERPASDEGAVARFERERRILASLEHPGIARLLDGGIAADGRPWFAMERVEGTRIDEHCDARRLDLPARLGLFAEVGRAVAAAHRQLVVHRDIKPSNILVSAEGRPKLLDFGIAKLIEDDGGAASDLTHAAMPMTPGYASPEQVSGLPVTTASDVYQLGLLLHELLCGERAFPAEGSSAAALSRRADGPEPTKPSAMLTTPAAEARARLRGCGSARHLRRLLEGDLDTIVTTALRPGAERRYESAARLVEDVERHLAGRPILARPDSPAYRVRKFVGRHRWAVGVATVATLALVTLALVDAAHLRAERDAAEREAQKARRISRFLTELFEATDPFTAKKVMGRTAVELLDEGARRLEAGGALTDEPDVRSALFDTLGRVYGGLGVYDKSLHHIGQAVALRRERLGPSHVATLESRLLEISLKRSAGRRAEARELARELLPEIEAALPGDDFHVSQARMQLALSILEEGAHEEARQLMVSALAIEEAQGPPDPERLSRLLGVFASVSDRCGDYELSIAQGRRAIELLRTLDPRSPRIARNLMAVASSLGALGRENEARETRFEAERLLLERVGLENPLTLQNSFGIAADQIDSGDAAAGLARLDAHIPIAERTLGPKSHWLGYARMRRATALMDLGRIEEALAEAVRARDLTVAALGEGAPLAIDANRRLAGIQKDAQRPAEARDTLQRTLALAEEKLPATSTVIPTTLDDLAQVELALGDLAAAERSIAKAIALSAAAWPGGHVDVVRLLATQAEVLGALGQAAGARASVARATAMLAHVEGVTPALRERLATIEAALPR